MKKHVLLALLAGALTASNVYAEWSLDRFMIFMFGATSGAKDEARVKALADAGVTVIDGDREMLDLCEKHGMQLLVHGVEPDETGLVSNHPALFGYHIIDEPLHNVPALEKLHQAYRENDPEHLDYSNLISLGGTYLEDYMTTIEPRMLSYDFYQYWWGQHGHFEKLEVYREAALKAGVPLVVFFEVDSNQQALWGWEGQPKTHHPNNEQRLRQGVFTALAYGIKGVEWFWSRMMFEEGTSTLNENGRDVAAINADLNALGPVLMNLNSVDVFHTWPLPSKARPIPEDHWVQVFNHGYPGLVLGMLEDDEGVEYAMVSNRNADGKQLVCMEIRRKYPIAKVERFDRKTSTWVSMPVREILTEKYRNKIAQAYDFYMYSQRTGGDNITYRHINERWTMPHEGNQLVEFELAPGDGELFRITRDLSFKTIRQQGKNY